MLNDLHEIERALTAFGIVLGETHPDVKEMAKGPALRVRLAEGGRLASVEIVREAGGGSVWTLRDGQHNGFPGLKTAAGLLTLDEAAGAAHQAQWEKSKEPSRRRDELLRLLSDNPPDSPQSVPWPSTGHRRRIAERLEQLRVLVSDPLTAAVPAAFERFLSALDRTPTFLIELRSALDERLHHGDDPSWTDIVRVALVGPIALVIDVEELEFTRGASDPRQIEAVCAALGAAGDLGAAPSDRCALGSEAKRLHAGNFPQPNLPGLGQTYLFSRNRDIPSLSRYGQTADASFPVGEALVRRLAATITALTRAERKGKTWRLIPAENGDKPDLLVVSLADPDLSAADAMADHDDGENGETALEEIASHVVDQSKGLVKTAAAEDQVQILILRTVDPANRKAIYHRRIGSAALFEAARAWRRAVRNTPEHLGLPIPVKGEAKALVRHPGHVSPLSIIALSRTAFEDRGRRRVDMGGVCAADAFQLFLNAPGADRRAREMLRLLLRRHQNLFGGLAAARRRGVEALRTHDPKADLRRDALRSATWIGALLHHLGRNKEAYMSGAGFLLGQLLSTADAVHVGYCLDVRDGGIPPTLLGNALLSTAAERPLQALGLLLKRWPPYAAWAGNARAVHARIAKDMRDAQTEAAKKAIESDAKAIRWALSQAWRVKPIAEALCEQLPLMGERTDETFRAELLLGYMAGLPPIERKQPGGGRRPSDIDENSEGGEP